MDIFNLWLVESPIANRGLHDKDHPENTLSAFAKAIDLGFPIAIDVQMIADGTLVVFSDECLSRLTENDGYIKFLSATDLDMLSISGSSEKIPSLQEVLTFIDGRVPLLIDIKNTDKVGVFEKNLLEILSGYNGEYAVMSMNPFSLEYFYKHAPNVLRGQMGGYQKGKKMSFFKRYISKSLCMSKKVSHPDFICYESKHLPNRFVRKYKTLPLIAHVVTSQSEYLRTVKYCDNIIFENFEPKI